MSHMVNGTDLVSAMQPGRLTPGRQTPQTIWLSPCTLLVAALLTCETNANNPVWCMHSAAGTQQGNIRSRCRAQQTATHQLIAQLQPATQGNKWAGLLTTALSITLYHDLCIQSYRKLQHTKVAPISTVHVILHTRCSLEFSFGGNLTQAVSVAVGKPRTHVGQL
jgi:hypothetical protein